MTPLLSKKQAAALLGVSTDCIDDLRTRGHLQAVKLGRLVMFDESALRNCIESLREKPSSPRARQKAEVIDLAAALARGEAALGKGRPVRSSPRE